jgi:hypothetical protein
VFYPTLSDLVNKGPLRGLRFHVVPAHVKGADSGRVLDNRDFLGLFGLECFEGMVLQWFVWVEMGSEWP